MLTLAVALLALTIPQRKALGAHLIAYAHHLLAHGKDPVPVLSPAQAHGIAGRILSTAVAQVTPTDMGVLEAAVYLSPARDLIPTTTLRALERAWTKLDWTWVWPGMGFDAAVSIGDTSGVDKALAAEEKIRALLNPPPPRVLPTPPAVDSVWVVVQTGTWIQVVDIGTGVSVQWKAISPIGDRGQTLLDTWARNLAEGVIAALYVVPFGKSPDAIYHSPTGVHPGSCLGCHADPKTWGQEVPDAECSNCGKRYWSGEGHPTIALCLACWKPRSKARIVSKFAPLTEGRTSAASRLPVPPTGGPIFPRVPEPQPLVPAPGSKIVFPEPPPTAPATPLGEPDQVDGPKAPDLDFGPADPRFRPSVPAIREKPPGQILSLGLLDPDSKPD